MEPPEEYVSMVIDFAGLNPVDDRSLVINALKQNDNNAERVVQQYFDDAVSFRSKYISAWNESMFSAERDGSGTNSAGISFHIESVNQNDIIHGATPPPSGYGIGAPSRPPSRSNDRSPLGRVVEWTAGEPTAGPSFQSQEDVDIERALRESAQEAGIGLPLLEQEAGILDPSTSTPYFGPANRTDYDQGNWAMVPIGTSSVATPTVPAPSLRKRAPGAPAFLVQGISTIGSHRLGGMLTILHQIPLARNVLLGCGPHASSYGFNAEWWNGQQILPPHVENKLEIGELRWDDYTVEGTNFDEEIHRLMAFLDSTERSHGNVSVLTKLTPYASSGPERQFYEHLRSRNGDQIEPLCQVATLATVRGDDPGIEDAKFGILEMDHVRAEYANITTLYESLDHLMWTDVLSWNEAHEGAKMAMFREMGEILTIKIGGDGPEDSIEIPEELYPEKYLATRKDDARRIQLAWCSTKNSMTKIMREEEMLQTWRNDWHQENKDKKVMIERVQEQWGVFANYLQSAGSFSSMAESGFDINKYPDYKTAPLQLNEDQKFCEDQVNSVIQIAERVLLDIESRTKELRSQLDKLKAKQRFLGKLLTDPNKNGRPSPMTCKRYLLRGMATDANIVYVCQRLEADLIDLEEKPKALDQWWKLAYTPNIKEAPVKAEKIEIERAMREVWQETSTPLLIYATEEALNVPRESLSDSMERFVRSDNRSFRQELKKEHAEASEEKPWTAVDPLSPSKRKHRDSMDSMNSNRASLGSDERNPGDYEDPFGDPVETQITELQDMSGVGPEITRSIDMSATIGDLMAPPPTANREFHGVESHSATLTPDTVAAEDADLLGEAPLDEVKPPEMQEVARPVPLIGAGAAGLVSDHTSNMDMEIPDHEE